MYKKSKAWNHRHMTHSSLPHFNLFTFRFHRPIRIFVHTQLLSCYDSIKSSRWFAPVHKNLCVNEPTEVIKISLSDFFSFTNTRVKFTFKFIVVLCSTFFWTGLRQPLHNRLKMNRKWMNHESIFHDFFRSHAWFRTKFKRFMIKR